MSTFHFLRPWTYALLPLAVFLLVYLWRTSEGKSNWQRFVDPALLPYLLTGTSEKEKGLPFLLLGLCFFIGITALAGPVWQKKEQPVFRSESSLVIILDLSRSMDAEDIKPSRLKRVQLKLLDILKQRKEGQTALVVYAANPFVVSPLTPDTETIALQVKSLSTDWMPAKGSRPDRALLQAKDILQQAGELQGDILMITDGIGESETAALAASVAPASLSVLGVGTPEGAPIPLKEQGFLEDATGAIVLPSLEEEPLRLLARDGKGRYHQLSGDDRDIEYLLPQKEFAGFSKDQQESGGQSEEWQEEGPWLVLVLLPFAALLFRRGLVLSILLAGLLTLSPSAAEAAWPDPWLRQDQQGARALEQQDAAKAAELFTDFQWKAAASYQAGEYEKALELQQGEDGTSLYNRGNSLARLGKYEEAKAAYQQALEKDPDNTDAAENLEIIKKELEKQEPQQQPSDGEDKEGDNADQEQDQNKDQQDQGDQDSEDSQEQQGSENTQDQDDKESNPDKEQQQQEGDSQEQSEEQQQQSQSQQGDEKDNKDQEQKAAPQPQETEEEPPQMSEEEREVLQKLMQIQDDPGGLWRRKFKYQHQQRYQNQEQEQRQW